MRLIFELPAIRSYLSLNHIVLLWKKKIEEIDATHDPRQRVCHHSGRSVDHQSGRIFVNWAFQIKKKWGFFQKHGFN